MIRVIGDKLQHCFYGASGRLWVRTPRNIQKISDHAYDPVDVSCRRGYIYVGGRSDSAKVSEARQHCFSELANVWY
jgi:hypothetical protein